MRAISTPSLLEIQRELAGSLLTGNDEGIVRWIAGGSDEVRSRIEIHRNNIRVSLSDALAGMFPVVRRLVGDGFFAFAAHNFLRAEPPQAPCVAEYGVGFGDFLATFEPCGNHAYLPDVARFERLLHDAARRPCMAPLETGALAGLSDGQAAHVVFGFQPCFGYMRSAWPLAAIWRANQEGGDGTVEMTAGETFIEVCRSNGVVEFRELAPAIFAFRAALKGGESLAAALHKATTLDSDFDISRALVDLFDDQALAGFSVE